MTPRLIASILLLLAGLMGCEGEDSSVVAPVNTAPSGGGDRSISRSLLASCPKMPAARLAADPGSTIGGPVVPSGSGYGLDYGFFDTTGRFLGGGKREVPDPNQASSYLLFNGKDAAGNRLPTGHYLVFLEVRDLEGNLIREQSTCFGFVASP